MTKRSPAARRIAVLAFDGISPFHLSVPCMVFAEDRLHPAVPRFDVKVCCAEAGPIATSAGFSLQAAHGLRAFARADIVIVPSWRDPAETPPRAVLDALRAAHARGAIVVGLCLGAFVLAAAGLLDGRDCTTHWGWCDDLRRQAPLATIRPEVLYVDGGDILTSAGVAAGIDCCLHLLRRLHGAEVAGCVARRMVVPLHRQGGQAQFIRTPLLPHGEADRFAAVMEGLARQLSQPVGLDELAARALMSRRTFTRRFRQATGTTVGQWLLAQRLALAQELLEASDKSIEAIAHEAGFGTALSLRKHFRTRFKTLPSRYREEFRGAP